MTVITSTRKVWGVVLAKMLTELNCMQILAKIN